MGEEKERATAVVVIERGNPLVLALLREHAPLTIGVVLALASHASIELVNWQVGDPLGAYERWVSSPHNGNHRIRAAWFFAAAGLWLYPASLVLAVLAAKRVAGAERAAARVAWLLVGITLVALLFRLIDLGLLSATLGLEN